MPPGMSRPPSFSRTTASAPARPSASRPIDTGPPQSASRPPAVSQRPPLADNPSNVPGADQMPNFLELQSRIDRTNPNPYSSDQLRAMGNRLQGENQQAAAVASGDVARRMGRDVTDAAGQRLLAQIGLGSAAQTAAGIEDVGFRNSAEGKQNELALLGQTMGLASLQSSTALGRGDLGLREELGRENASQSRDELELQRWAQEQGVNLSRDELDLQRWAQEQGFNLSREDLELRRLAQEQGFDLSRGDLDLRRWAAENGINIDRDRLALEERRTESDINSREVQDRLTRIQAEEAERQQREQQQRRQFTSPWHPPRFGGDPFGYDRNPSPV